MCTYSTLPGIPGKGNDKDAEEEEEGRVSLSPEAVRKRRTCQERTLVLQCDQALEIYSVIRFP